MKNIRSVKIEDAPKLVDLLEQLGYPNAESFIEEKLEIVMTHSDENFTLARGERRHTNSIADRGMRNLLSI